MIIIEGTDGVGKTTLARAILGMLGTHVYVHMDRPPAEFDFLWGYINMYNPTSVYDRLWLSELAYTKARNEETRIARWKQQVLIEFFDAAAYTIILTAPAEVISNRYEKAIRAHHDSNGKFVPPKSEMYDLSLVLAANDNFKALASRDADNYAVDMWVSEVFDTDELAHEIVNKYRGRNDLVRD